MKLLKISVLVVMIIVATFLFFQSRGLAYKPASVRGKTVDREGNGINDIRIRAYSVGQKVAETKSANGGQYSITVSDSIAFDLVFDSPGWQPGLDQTLSGNAEHRVTKVILRDGEILDPRSRLAAEYAQKYIESLGQ